MVEIRNDQLRADPSQGSHFFQNITSLGIPYVTINENGNGEQKKEEALAREADYLDWQWLLAIKPVEDGEYMRHLRLETPFSMKCNAKESESVIYHRPH